MSQIEQLPVSSKDICNETRKDQVLSKVLEFTKNGWENDGEKLLAPFYTRRNESSSCLQCKLDNFLFTYRRAPHATTNESPAKLFLGRELRTHLDLLKPDIRKRVEKQQEAQRRSRENAVHRQYKIGDHVCARFYRGEEKWKQGVIVETCGPLTYIVEIEPEISTLHKKITVDLNVKPDSQVPTLDAQEKETESFPIVVRRYPERIRHTPVRLEL
ncbi:uncharacterized protein LOC144357029 [Saccoglossus kowalevskii]